jgi:chemotaxis protein MotA
MRYTLAGVVLAVLLLVIAVLGSGPGAFWRFVDPHSLGIVFGGLAAAALISFRESQLRAMARGCVLMFRDDASIEPEIQLLVKFAGDYVRKDVRGAEATINDTQSPFLKLGFQLVLDSTPIDDLLRILEWRIKQMREEESSTARCFRSLAAFAPAFGMLGTLVGLIAMLANLTTPDFQVISANMALALTATLYGVITAYLVFRPISLKLEQRTARRVFVLHVLMDGLVLIRTGRGPALVEDNLRHLLHENRDEVRGID